MQLRSPRQLLRYTLLALLIAPAISAPATSNTPTGDFFGDLIVRDVRQVVPDGFIDLGILSADATITLELGLFGRDIGGLEKQLLAVSTPGKKTYRKYLSKEQVESYVKPTEETVKRVNAWLAKNGIQAQTISAAGDRLQISLPASKANKMFQASFSTFRHAETGTESVQTLAYSLPSELATMIESVEPTTSFPNPSLPFSFETFARRDTSDTASCEQKVTPSCLQTLYGMPTARATQSNNLVAVPGFVQEYANYADLSTFLTNFRPDLSPQPNFTVQLIDGGQNPQDPSKAGVEANLDIQYTVGLINGISVNFISSGMSNINGFTNLANSLLNQQTVPTVLSVSYGFNEDQVSSNSANNLCNVFMQLGARGTSVLIASGDGGVAGSRPNDTCTTFVPTFPASCPYITAVGATQNVTAEVAAELSAGGFSNYFSRPSYQSASVSNYLGNLGSTYQGRYNPNGRAIPDVSAQGKNLTVVVGGNATLVDGTSASAPIFASVIALLNDQLLQKTGSPLGFLNPLIYNNPGIFNDIVSGSNPSCGTPGFSASAGWDPVTGLGTPNFTRFAAAVDL